MKWMLLMAAWLPVPGVFGQTGSLSVYYVGNMGVALVKNDSVVLIDALHDYYDVYYLPSDPAVLKKINTREKPFQKLVAVLATHLHNDHFDDSLISQISRHHPESWVLMGKQPAEKLTGVDGQRLRSVNQTGVINLARHLTIALKNVRHSGSRNKSVENYRIEVIWGRHRIVHFGDAPDATSVEGLLPGADIAIVPYWFCYDAKDLRLLESKKIKKIIATHIDPAGVTPFGKSSVEIIAFKTYGQQFIVN